MLDLIRELWSSACQNAPKRPSCQIVDGRFVLTITGNRANWNELTKLSGVPSTAVQDIQNDTLAITWPSVSDFYFGLTGPLAEAKANYEPRQAQINMARLVQRTIEMNDAAMIEAGTGTGKGFAYLIPALAMNKRIIVSTSNKALQSQLIDHDLPFLLEMFPGKKVALAQGKSNYACRAKCDGLTARLTGDLAEWYATTPTGNMEEISFELTPKERQSVAIDDECPGQKICPQGATCFYYKAKAERQKADVIVTNHALLTLDLAFPRAELLPQVPVIVVDEAHKLPDYARSMLASELTDGKLRSTVDEAEAYDPSSPVDRLAGSFFADLGELIRMSNDPTISVDKTTVSVDKTTVVESGVKLAAELHAVADTIWDNEVMPSDPDERRLQREANRIHKVADKVIAFSLPPAQGWTRWIERSRDLLKIVSSPYDVAPFLKNLVGYELEQKTVDRTRCARCGRELTAAVVNVLEGRPYGPDCIRMVDVFGDAEQMDLATWLGDTTEITVKPAGKHATVFCSATLANPTMDQFMRECGILGGMQMIAESPFDYRRNALLYIPAGACPAPSDPKHLAYVMEEMERLVTYSQGSAFLLFTSNRYLWEVSRTLAPEFKRKGFPVYVQGEGLGKMEIGRRFKADGNAVLFGTKSFFEGVSIEGDALRLVVIDKMPFAAPHPITVAMEADLQVYAREVLKLPADKVEWYPFNHMRIPTMLTDLKQGFGRLIRTVSDYGTVAILDPRLRTTAYGRNTVIPALPPAVQTHEHYMVADFFAQHKAAPIAPVIKAPRPAPVVVDDFTLIEEMAF